MIRVALVDDQAMVRAGLARILSPTDGFEVVAECGDVLEAVEEVPEARPDVIGISVGCFADPRWLRVQLVHQRAGAPADELEQRGDAQRLADVVHVHDEHRDAHEYE